jgi:hypothetical protein
MNCLRVPCGYCKRRIRIDHASFVVKGIPFCCRTHFLAWELANTASNDDRVPEIHAKNWVGLASEDAANAAAG